MPIDMKNVISNTLVEMAQKKGIDKVTVKALIDACHISRQTFYYHFQDLMEVIEWTMEQAMQEILEKSLRAETPQEVLKILISFAMENRTLFCKLLDSQKRAQMEKLFVQAAKTYLQELLRNKSHEYSLNYSDMEVALDFLSYGITGMLFQCCRQSQVDVEKLAQQICRLLPQKTEQDLS